MQSNDAQKEFEVESSGIIVLLVYFMFFWDAEHLRMIKKPQEIMFFNGFQIITYKVNYSDSIVK